jgi:hypothetical protein
MSAERLTRLGDFPSSLLFNLYRARPPAASGGVWDRVAAIQTLDAALIEDDTDAVLAALADADTALSAVGLRSSLAEGYGAALSELSLSNAPSIRMAEILLLGGDAETAERWSVPSSPSERLRIALAIGKNVAPTAGTDQSIEILRATAASDAMNGQVATTAEHARMQTMITQDRRGEAILTALAILDAGEEIEPNDFAVALDILVKSDQRETAKRIALQTILSRP